ncbi:hypothetical protein JMJ77_0007648, partial [Colletotrichum scovillei]
NLEENLPQRRPESARAPETFGVKPGGTLSCPGTSSKTQSCQYKVAEQH